MKIYPLTYKNFLSEMRDTVGIYEIPNISSSNIKEMFYQDTGEGEFTLYVVFHNRHGDPDKYYIYDGIPQNLIDILEDANDTPLASVGGMFNKYVKGGNYDYEPVDFEKGEDD